jgi:hypothetical protein
MTPLYKFLKSNGTSFYAFPGAAEDISAAYQNQSYKMYFSKFTLLNFPKQNLSAGSGTASKPIYWDFDNSFVRSVQATPASSYKDELVESLRNYVANFEVTMKESRLNNTEYYYDSNVLETPTEKIFWKWCKQMNLIDFELSQPSDEYFDNLAEFETNDPNDVTYFKEYLWRERKPTPYNVISVYESALALNKFEIEFGTPTHFKVNDVLKFYNITNNSLRILLGTMSQLKVLEVADNGQRVVTDLFWNDDFYDNGGSTIAKGELVYHKLVQYIGEINGVNNVQDKNRSYTEVYAHIPDHTGRTPDILFRTKTENNYKPNLVFPILPAQYQPEINGAELFNSPIVSSPQNYPGNYFGQFDTEDFTYEISSGDSIRRSGDYYGISGDLENLIVDTTNLDGLTLDFDTSHYSKMNIRNRVLGTFEQFNSLEVNNQPPQDFEFNAVLWYYTVEDSTGASASNLYGISILDNPDNNTNQDEIFQGNGLRIPLYKKLAANDNQDGTSYAFSLNLNFNIANENPQDTYNPEAINSLFGFNLFNEAMTSLAKINESFMTILSNQSKVEDDVNNLRQLLYSQTDLQVINNRISNLESLLKLYSTNQISNSDSITVTTDTSQSPPAILLNNRDTNYSQVIDIKTQNLYNSTGNVPYVVNIPEKKNFLLNVINDDTTSLNLPNNQNLEIVINSDLSYKQSMDIVVNSTDLASQNKQLDVFLNYKFGNSTPVLTRVLDTIDLPIYLNTSTQLPNTSKVWKEVSFTIDLDKQVKLTTGSILEVPLVGNPKLISNSFKVGDIFMIDDFVVGTSSSINFSGQYPIVSVSNTGIIYFNVSSNQILINYGNSKGLPLIFNNNTGTYLLSNIPKLKLNKGIKFTISRISLSETSEFKDRYLIERQML